MVTVTCIDRKCGVVFGIPEHIEAQARRDPERSVICPNGHSFVYTDSEPDRLRKRIAALEADLVAIREQRDQRWRDLIKSERTVRYWKGIAHRRSR